MKDKGVYHYKIKTVYHFVDSNLGVEISSNKRLTEKEGRGGSFGSCLPERGAHDLPWGRKSLPEGPGVGGNYTY